MVRKFFKNKKAFEMIFSTIVVIILAFLLLAVLILIFTNAGNSFYENIKGYFSTTNTDSVIKACNFDVSSGNSNGFCCEVKEVIYLDSGNKVSGNFVCSDLVNKSFINNKITSNINCSGVVC